MLNNQFNFAGAHAQNIACHKGQRKCTYDKKVEEVGDQSYAEHPQLFIASAGLGLLFEICECEQSKPQGDGKDLSSRVKL